MTTNNNTQKNLIRALTQTHQEPAKAFRMVLEQAKTKEQAEQIERMAKALGVGLFSGMLATRNAEGERLTVEISACLNWLIVTEYRQRGMAKHKITGEEFAQMWKTEEERRNNLQEQTKKDFKA